MEEGSRRGADLVGSWVYVQLKGDLPLKGPARLPVDEPDGGAEGVAPHVLQGRREEELGGVAVVFFRLWLCRFLLQA